MPFVRITFGANASQFALSEGGGGDALCAAAAAGDLPTLLWQLWQVGVPINATAAGGGTAHPDFKGLHAVEAPAQRSAMTGTPSSRP